MANGNEFRKSELKRIIYAECFPELKDDSPASKLQRIQVG